MTEVEIYNNSLFRVSKIKLTKTIDKWIKHLKIKKSCILSLAIVDDKAIKKINSVYRGINKPTDVLSFAEIDTTFKTPMVKQKAVYLGEIIISYDRLKKQASREGASARFEFNSLLAHGFLHLAGFDHRTDKEEKIMKEKEKQLIKLIP